MWKPDAGLVYDDGTERSSMEWLRNYMNEQEDVGYPMSGSTTSSGPQLSTDHDHVDVFPNPSGGIVTLRNNSKMTEKILIYDIYGRQIDYFELNAHSQTELNLLPGIYLVKGRNQKTIKFIVK